MALQQNYWAIYQLLYVNKMWKKIYEASKINNNVAPAITWISTRD